MAKNDGRESAAGRRSLAAIVFTDVVDFSVRMGEEEEHTLGLVRRDMDYMKKLCERYEGQVLKSTGDGCSFRRPPA